MYVVWLFATQRVLALTAVHSPVLPRALLIAVLRIKEVMNLPLSSSTSSIDLRRACDQQGRPHHLHVGQTSRDQLLQTRERKQQKNKRVKKQSKQHGMDRDKDNTVGPHCKKGQRKGKIL